MPTICRTFSADDQHRFAALSGDRNPMHMDPVAARRTQAGAPVVHGVHLAIWALDALAAAGELPAFTHLRVGFDRFVYVGDSAAVSVTARNGTARKAEIASGGMTVVRLETLPGEPATRPPPSTVETPPPLALPQERDLADMAEASGRLALAASSSALAAAFPHAAALMGPLRLAALAGMSAVIGMACPGLQSIFVNLDLACVDQPGAGAFIDWSVASADTRVRLVRLDVCGGGLAGTLLSIARVPPAVQVGMAAIAPHVARDAFAGSTALIIGGSRGLGELTARILAAGGARIALTYATGSADAAALSAELQDWAASCMHLAYDARQPPAPQLAALPWRPSHVYYFATPAIFRPKPQLLTRARLTEFLAFYVDGFYALCQALTNDTADPVTVFYPSTVAVAERPRDMTEYAMAKAAGEILCTDLSTQLSSLRIVSRRLPRLPTDQTQSVLAGSNASPLAVMLPIIRAMHEPRGATTHHIAPDGRAA